ncbi:MAG: alpha/beta hydrolase, partial [Kovacikia sp.]
MVNYSEKTVAIAEQAKAREDKLPLLNQSCRSRFFFQPQPTKRVCLFFHGFTAGPYQFVPMGEAFFRAGYNVLVPLLP